MIEEEEWSKEQEANRKPGQKHPTPSPGFADRVFYESLLQQRPDSRMAQKWCLEYGVLKWAEAEALCQKLGVTVNVKRPGKSPKLKKPKGAATGILKAMDESATAEAMEITGGGFEGVGLGAL
ncbi:hypothetical protein PRIC1_005941 [Phytophthora ramorum]|uniref:uncharacterized protein n=1 Tax=Phytophthora ramorum TaxID=164328 RepID=UPI0030A29674|nr:hypothetical protein KRP23_13847 [Phytophthora ramorum]KAH7506599.1 hypothetical protein KRP22_4559 [Phytophthora ramorum]